jgi:YidC/Oxa1 family membrane protein insertase
MNDQKNTLLFIMLSAVILIGWQLWFGMPQQKPAPSQNPPVTTAPGTPTPGAPGSGAPGSGAPGSVAPPAPSAPVEPAKPLTREEALAQSPRVPIQTPRLSGSIALKGGRIDDLSLTQYRETVDPKSPPIVLLAPPGSPHPLYAQWGWLPPAGSTIKRPDETTVWTQQGSGPLTIDQPLQLVFDNGEGLEFRRTISVDDKYMFTIRDEVANKGSAAVALYPFGSITRHGTPKLEGYLVSHEGFVGVLADRVQEEKYSEVEKKIFDFQNTQGWLGFTDKYWAATLIPDPAAKISARFRYSPAGALKTYHAEFNLESVTIPPGGTAGATTRLFAGAKEVALIDSYNNALKLDRFDHLIDWGYFYFITKPLFIVMDWIYHVVGNFGIAILLITVVIKLIFFPLANKSYASMAKMKAVQPEMMAIRERYADDKMKQQQAMMELYKKEQINPIAGCLPIVIQIPVFFALYKVLFITIEMRQAPFFGWIQDLSAPDPTTIFNLFGLIPWDPSHVPLIGPFLMLGVWPLIMGVTMWVQMKLNPPPPDPTQQMIFDWMPVIFTFMLSSFSAGLVIYWAWNNTLSVIQQSVIMRRNGAKIELFDNIKAAFTKKKVTTTQ